MRDERGQVLPLALVALAVGTLLTAPFLSQANITLISSRNYGQAITEQYSADAGVEYAIWYLQYGGLEVPEGGASELPEFTINNETVNVTVENEGDNIYNITSTGTSDDGGSIILSTTIRSIPWIEGDLEASGNDTYYGDVHVTGDISVSNNAAIIGNVTIEGNLTLENNGEITGNVTVEGDITLENNTEITGIICATGNVTLENNADITGDISLGGNLTLENNADIEGDIFIDGDITLAQNADITGNVYATGDITITFNDPNPTIDGDVYATGAVTIVPAEREGNITGGIWEDYGGAYPDPPGCPGIPASPTDIQTWEITSQ